MANQNLPWLRKTDPDIDDAVSRLVNEYIDRKTHCARLPTVCAKAKKNLEQAFKNAEQSRSKVYKFDHAFAKALGIKGRDLTRSVVMGNMKDMENALRKEYNKSSGGPLNDLARSRILIRTLDEYDNALKIIEAAKGEDKNLKPLNIDVKDVRIRTDRVDDYLSKASPAGYAGSLNFDIEIDLGKGRTAISEVQVIPEAYLSGTYGHSHILYELAKIIKHQSAAYKTPADEAVKDVLISANKSLFFEYGTRSGFIEVQEDLRDFTINDKEHLNGWDILDRIRTALEDTKYGHYKKPPKWFKKTTDALSYAKTSLSNTYFATSRTRVAPSLEHE